MSDDQQLLADAKALRRELRDCWRLINGLLTDDQLDFVQPDGKSARQRIRGWVEVLERTGYLKK